MQCQSTHARGSITRKALNESNLNLDQVEYAVLGVWMPEEAYVEVLVDGLMVQRTAGMPVFICRVYIHVGPFSM